MFRTSSNEYNMERDNDAEAMQAYSGDVSQRLRSEGGGQVIDAYNHTYRQGICHTIKCNVDSANLTYVVVDENTNRGGKNGKNDLPCHSVRTEAYLQ